MTFEEWWQTAYPNGVVASLTAVELAFKEVAEKAWNAGFNSGYDSACADHQIVEW